MTDTELARIHGITPQYVGIIRREAPPREVVRRTLEETDARIEGIVGVATVTEKRARCVEDLFDVILLALDDLKRSEDITGRERSVSVLARALRDVTECAAALRKASVLEEMSDEDVRAALQATSN